MNMKRQSKITIPHPVNINPPIKNIEIFENRIVSELIKKGDFGKRRQEISVSSCVRNQLHGSGWDNTTPSSWMRELLGNHMTNKIRSEFTGYLRAQINKDFAPQQWKVTWLARDTTGFVVKMHYTG